MLISGVISVFNGVQGGLQDSVQGGTAHYTGVKYCQISNKGC